jgi:hypothetical protein
MTASATAPGARLERGDEGRLSIILPGVWSRIPMDSEEEANAEIARVIKRQFPRRDELATMRRDARESMRAIARDAHAEDAVLVGMSLELLPGLPFAAALIVTYVDAPHPELDLPLEVRIATTVPDGEVVELEGGLAGREWVRAVAGPDDPPDAVTTIAFRYVLPTPFEGRWAKVSASVPTEADPELIVELFDAIVGTIRWYPPGE